MRSHLRSLRGRLVVLLLLLIAAAIATGVLMIDLFRQSATAQVGEADAEIGRACDAIAGAYRFYSAGWQRQDHGRSDRSAQSPTCRGWDLAERSGLVRLCLPDL